MSSEKKLKVLYLGWYPHWYPRNWVIQQGLMRQGVEIREMRVGPKRISRYFNLLAALRRYQIQYKDPPDLIIVAMVDLESFPFAWALARRWGCPVVYDAFYPRHDAAVVCEQETKQGSMKAKALFRWEKRVLKAADLILADTRQNAAFFHQTCGTPEDKFEVVYVGTDQEIFKPGPEPHPDPFLVQFVGYYLRLHGAKYIIQAADILREHKDIRFEMIGYARRRPYHIVQEEVRRLRITNVVFRDEVPHSKLPGEMQRASLCLGIFEDIGLAARVIPNKGYHALAVARPLLTRESPAIREALQPEEHVWTCPPADPRALADAILFLKNNPETRNRIARKGYERFSESFTPQKVTASLLERIERTVKDHHK